MQLERPHWPIDVKLDRLIGTAVRVAVDSFAPPGRPEMFSPAQGLFLPDNTTAEGRGVFFEGVLRSYTRRIGVVYALLDALPIEQTAQGVTFFRGGQTTIVRGPAAVKLAFPFRVEALPKDPANYWRDLRYPRCQFAFPFLDPSTQKG